MLINLSNHPSANWSAEQLAAAKVYGNIIDLPFPDVNPTGDEEYIQTLCNDYTAKIGTICVETESDIHTVTVHIMGEMTFTFAMVNILQKRGIACIASTTERITSVENGVRISEFKFKRFREYVKY